ncbi:chromosome transmission fidelity factor [Planoprotostelium fungivorum]|uniref:Chromosome transmission fidelity factor n=1 Tax=Planoprotostelium fungivorum TaxID=1890364 RepID=A0A2P6N6P5_9EUKA|nr:chromosome transmission fidelity factor [Planoprotostelium fungivorum]
MSKRKASNSPNEENGEIETVSLLNRGSPISKRAKTTITPKKDQTKKPSSYSHIDHARDAICSTSESGERTYISLREKPSVSMKTFRKSGQLLATPINDLLDQMTNERIEKAYQKVQEAEKIAAGKQTFRKQKTASASNQMWVDKYKPTRFMELLSSEQSNRAVLQWLKNWDETVFGTQAGKLPTPPASKILLLSGPPGAGKTTLAHVVAKHCGYKSVEINASDDRTTKVFEGKVRDAVEMKANWIGGNKPNCLIIDEIDGIHEGNEGESAVNVLLSLLREDKEEPTDNPDKKKKKSRLQLSRPIICICNNQYAPSLRKLRTAVTVFDLDKPTPTRLIQRLKEVCMAEGVRVDQSTLLSLCELNECDVRSCLHSLQFLAAKHSTITSSHIVDTSVGLKDIPRNIFELWQSIFQKQSKVGSVLGRLLAQKRREGDKDKENNSQLRNLTVGLNNSASDLKRVMEGCHEHFLRVNYIDPMITKTVETYDWMIFFEEMSGGAHGSWELSKYSTTAPLAIHNLCSTASQFSSKFPTVDRNFRTKRNENRATVKTFLHDLQPAIHSSYTHDILFLDFIEPLLHILQPTKLQINPSLLTPQEREEINQLIRFMSAYNVRYKTKREADKLVYVMEPSLENLLPWEGSNRKSVEFSGRDGMKEFISSEMNREKFKKKTEIETPKTPSTTNQKTTPTKENSPSKGRLWGSPPEKKNKPNPPVGQVKDFFGRPLQPASPSTPKKAAAARVVEEKEKTSFKYRFQEGFTNAVRRTVYMKDL